jgi:hypothetical protein
MHRIPQAPSRQHPYLLKYDESLLLIYQRTKENPADHRVFPDSAPCLRAARSAQQHRRGTSSLVCSIIGHAFRSMFLRRVAANYDVPAKLTGPECTAARIRDIRLCLFRRPTLRLGRPLPDRDLGAPTGATIWPSTNARKYEVLSVLQHRRSVRRRIAKFW